MQALEPRIVWERYVSAWRATSAAERRAALVASVDPAAVYRDPLVRADGHDGLVDYMQQFHAQVPGGHFETITFLAHHDRSAATWHMRDGAGTIVGTGTSFGEYDARGMLVAMTGFFATPPAA